MDSNDMAEWTTGDRFTQTDEPRIEDVFTNGDFTADPPF